MERKVPGSPELPCTSVRRWSTREAASANANANANTNTSANANTNTSAAGAASAAVAALVEWVEQLLGDEGKRGMEWGYGASGLSERTMRRL